MNKKDHFYIKAKELRKKGKSYSEISKQMGVPKSTLSYWFSDKNWSRDVKGRLVEQQKRRNNAGLAKANRAWLRKKELRHARFCREARSIFKKLKKDSLFW
jgi:transposase-like protein